MISIQILEKSYEDFLAFLKVKGDNFKNFHDSKFLIEEEHYKYKVFDEAREALGFQWWKSEDIGTGKIQKAIASAIQTKVNYNLQMVQNNLIDWRKKDDFSKKPVTKILEQTLFNFYKSKISDGESFNIFLNEGLSYQFIAYLFFIKDCNKYLPISQEQFDRIFEQIGIPEFKTRNNASWDNYYQYCTIVNEVKTFLKVKDSSVKLLDAHSFLWVLGKIGKIDENINSNANVTNTYLFAWNPDKWPWNDLLLNIEELNNKGSFTQMWTCGSYKSIKVGDRAFLLRLGSEPRGICGSGTVVSKPFLSKHWGDKDKETYRVLIQFDVILNPENETLLLVDDLKREGLTEQNWSPQNSGISIKPEIAIPLERIWFDLQSKNGIILNDPVNDHIYKEGNVTQVLQNRYERNPHARKKCLEYYGYSCTVCEFDFERIYGDIGYQFIHVHHLNQISDVGSIYEVNPIEDLRPVCPNCHAMLHKQNPPLQIKDLQLKLKRNEN